MHYINGEDTTGRWNQGNFTKRCGECRQKFLCELNRSQQALKGKENISITQCILTIGLMKQATIASMADRKASKEPVAATKVRQVLESNQTKTSEICWGVA